MNGEVISLDAANMQTVLSEEKKTFANYKIIWQTDYQVKEYVCLAMNPSLFAHIRAQSKMSLSGISK